MAWLKAANAILWRSFLGWKFVCFKLGFWFLDKPYNVSNNNNYNVKKVKMLKGNNRYFEWKISSCWRAFKWQHWLTNHNNEPFIWKGFVQLHKTTTNRFHWVLLYCFILNVRFVRRKRRRRRRRRKSNKSSWWMVRGERRANDSTKCIMIYSQVRPPPSFPSPPPQFHSNLHVGSSLLLPFLLLDTLDTTRRLLKYIL